MEEREKNAEKFYRSDSENEDDSSEKENIFSALTDNQACSDLKKNTDAIDKNETNEHTTLVSETEHNKEISDTDKDCVESTSQSDKVALIECKINNNIDKHLQCSGVNNEIFNKIKDKSDKYFSDNTVSKNILSECTGRNEITPDRQSINCDNTSDSNKYNGDDIFGSKENVKILKFGQEENGIIDLNSSELSGVSDLMQRFIKHTNLKVRTDEKSHVNIRYYFVFIYFYLNTK